MFDVWTFHSVDITRFADVCWCFCDAIPPLKSHQLVGCLSRSFDYRRHCHHRRHSRRHLFSITFWESWNFWMNILWENFQQRNNWRCFCIKQTLRRDNFMKMFTLNGERRCLFSLLMFSSEANARLMRVDQWETMRLSSRSDRVCGRQKGFCFGRIQLDIIGEGVGCATNRLINNWCKWTSRLVEPHPRQLLNGKSIALGVQSTHTHPIFVFGIIRCHHDRQPVPTPPQSQSSSRAITRRTGRSWYERQKITKSWYYWTQLNRMKLNWIDDNNTYLMLL